VAENTVAINAALNLTLGAAARDRYGCPMIRAFQRLVPTESPSSPQAQAMFIGAALLFISMPLAMWLQSRSAVGLLVVAAGLCAAGIWRQGRAAVLCHRAGACIQTPVGLFLALFLGWCLISIAWSHDRTASLAVWVELALPMVGGLIVALTLPETLSGPSAISGARQVPEWVIPAFVAVLAVALILTFAELAGLLQWRAAAGLRLNSFVFNRTMIFAAMMVACVVALAVRPGTGSRILFLVRLVIAIFCLALVKTDSGAVILGVIVASIVMIGTWVLPRVSLAGLAAGMVALAVFAPVQGEIADQLLPVKAHAAMAESHSRDRVDIWLAFGEAIRQRPLTGAGFGTSGSYARHPVAMQVPQARRTLLGAGHPHALQVQVWAETGVVGTCLLLMAGLALIGVLWRLPRRLRAVATAMTAGALAVAAVGHGAWQGWWIATLAVSCCWTALALHQQAHDLSAPRLQPTDV
jgi:O-antigen ligase